VQQLFLTIRIRIRPNPKHRGAFETPEVILIHFGRIKTNVTQAVFMVYALQG